MLIFGYSPFIFIFNSLRNSDQRALEKLDLTEGVCDFKSINHIGFSYEDSLNKFSIYK